MPRTQTGVTNTPEITVSELSGALKRTLEDRFGFVRVRGEISGYRGSHASGHVYFSLKDASARLDAVIWKATFLRMRFKPAEGLEVIASGKITTFAGKSAYQIIVESLEPAGIGALMALLEARRAQLAAEGLFDNARKRVLPFLPRTIGVVTSPTGAVIRDILHRLTDRFPVRVLVWPVRVQGENSADEIAAGIGGFNSLKIDGDIPRPDVLVVARGGGSLDDLWSFNEEIVVRAAAASEIPLVSAVGHETDWTLIDYAADLRAPTPTAAAELCVPVRSELAARLATVFVRGANGLVRLARQERVKFRSAVRALPNREDLLASPNQRKDRAADGLRARIRAALDNVGLGLATLSLRLARYSPQVQSVRASEQAKALAQRLRRVGAALTTSSRQDLQRVEGHFGRERARGTHQRRHLLAMVTDRWAIRLSEVRRVNFEKRSNAQRLQGALERVVIEGFGRRNLQLKACSQVFAAVNYNAVLARGYALVQDKAGRPISDATAARTAGAMVVRFSDGSISAKVDESRPVPRRRKRAETVQQPLLL